MVAGLLQVVATHAALAEIRREGLAALHAPGALNGPLRLYYRPSSRQEVDGPTWVAANLHAFYMIEEGGIYDQVFRNRRDNHILRETDAWARDLTRRSLPGALSDPRTRVLTMVYNGLTQDDVLLLSPSAQVVQTFVGYGFEPVFQSATIVRLRPPQRVLEVRVASPDPVTAAVLIDSSGVAYAQQELEPCGEAQWCTTLERLPSSELQCVVFRTADQSIVAQQTLTLSQPTTQLTLP
jgi:hypothetical protein